MTAGCSFESERRKFDGPFSNLNNRLKSIQTNDNSIKMGLNLTKIYDFKGDIPTNIDSILKYKGITSQTKKILKIL